VSSPALDPVRIGLLGYGFGGRYFHAPLLTAAPGCEFVGVVTTSAERRTLVADEHPGVPLLWSLAELAPPVPKRSPCRPRPAPTRP